jgi:hypothetical protein
MHDPQRHRPRLRTRPRGWVSAGAITTAMAVLAATPAGADDCQRTGGIFTTGSWVARGIEIGGQLDDGFGTINLHATGDFALQVDKTGQASGGLTLEGGSGSVMDGTDLSHAETTFAIEAELGGVANLVTATGTMRASMSGEIDVSGADGIGLPGAGDEMPDFTNEIERPWDTTIVPTSASCNQAMGTFGGLLEYDSDGSLVESEGGGIGTVWFAYRRGPSLDEREVEDEFVALIESAEVVLAQDPVDPDTLALFVADALSFDAMITAAVRCDDADLGGLTPGNPAYDLLRNVVNQAMQKVINAAAGGSIRTTDLAYLATLYLQSGVLGWRGPAGECSAADPTDETGSSIFNQLEDIFLGRYRQLRGDLETASGDLHDSIEQEMQVITATAYQLGMTRLMTEVES